MPIHIINYNYFNQINNKLVILLLILSFIENDGNRLTN